MLKRGRSGVGIELLPAELDYAAAAEIEAVDLTGIAPPVAAELSFGAWLAESASRAGVAVAQRQEARFAAAAATLLLLLLLLSAAEDAPQALFWLCAALLAAATAGACGTARARAAAHASAAAAPAFDSDVAPAMRTPHTAVV